MGWGECAIDSKLYVLGGLNQSLADTDWLDIYDADTDSWSSGAVYPLGVVTGAAVAVIGGILYVAGGLVTGSRTTAGRKYNPATDSWSSIASMPVERANAVGVAHGGYFYVIGGVQNGAGGTTVATIYRYNPATDSWSSSLANMPAARHTAGAAALGGYIYVVGGSDTNTLYRYDVAGDSWTTLTAIPGPTQRTGPFMSAIGGKLYAVNGDISFPSAASNHRYDPATDTWVSKTAPATGRRYGAWGVIDGHLHIVGGFRSGSDFRDEHERYAAELAIWRPYASLG